MKWDYFKEGWNLTDLAFCVFYIIYFRLENFDRTADTKDYYPYLPELKVAIMFLAIAKLMALIRVYDRFGLLVQMIVTCFVEL